MKLKRWLFLVFIIASLTQINAQTRHFTLHTLAPMFLNPATTGNFEGTARISGLFRDQDPNFTQSFKGKSNLYKTIYASIDAPLFMLRKRDWVSLGVMMIQDKAGSLDLTNNGNMVFSASYHLSLDKKSKNLFAFGLQGGKRSRSLNATDAVFGSEEESFKVGVNSEEDNSKGIQYWDIGAGVIFKSKIDKKSDLEIGFAATHLVTKPDSSYILIVSGGPTKLNVASTLHAKYKTEITKNWDIIPALYYKRIGPGNDDISIQTSVRSGFGEDKSHLVSFGLGFRVGDAIEFLLGYQKGPLQVGLGYDFSISKISSANNYLGAFEIAANYIIKKYKKPDINPVIICPNF